MESSKDVRYGRGNDARSVYETRNGDYIIIGTTNQILLLLKVSTSGSIIFNRTYNSYVFGHDIRETSDDGYIVAATDSMNFYSGWTAYLLKFNSNGQIVWEKQLSDSFFKYRAYTVTETPTGYVFAGQRCYYDQYGSLKCGNWLYKTDVGGNWLWERQFSSKAIRKIRYATDGALVIIEDMGGVSSLLRYYPKD